STRHIHCKHVEVLGIDKHNGFIENFVFIADQEPAPPIYPRCLFNFRKLADDFIPKRIRNRCKVVYIIIEVYVAYHHVQTVDVGIIPVVVQFVPDEKHDQNKSGETDCQPENIDKGKRLMTCQRPNNNFEVVSDHRIVRSVERLKSSVVPDFKECDFDQEINFLRQRI